jgi:hypothetical protein
VGSLALRWLDVVVLAVALAVTLAAGLPLLGWAAAAAAWVAQRGIQMLLTRRAMAAAGDTRRVTGVLALSMVIRGWLIALSIFAAGSADREAGLSAAVISIALLTAYLTSAMIGGGPVAVRRAGR